MRKLLVVLIIGMFLSANPAYAVSVYETDATSLYGIFNTFFYEDWDSGRMSSNIELMNNSGYLLSDGADTVFGDAGDTLRIDLTFSNASYGNELGYMDGDSYTALMDISGIERYNIYTQETTFTVSNQFNFADTVYISGDPMQRWYADASLNPLGNKDHFLAFSITDQALLDVCNLNYGTSFTAGIDDVWMIAFEDLNLGDADFDDLVAIVSRPGSLNHAPIPGSILLAFSGVMAIIFPRIRRRSLK